MWCHDVFLGKKIILSFFLSYSLILKAFFLFIFSLSLNCVLSLLVFCLLLTSKTLFFSFLLHCLLVLKRNKVQKKEQQRQRRRKKSFFFKKWEGKSESKKKNYTHSVTHFRLCERFLSLTRYLARRSHSSVREKELSATVVSSLFLFRWKQNNNNTLHTFLITFNWSKERIVVPRAFRNLARIFFYLQLIKLYQRKKIIVLVCLQMSLCVLIKN